MPGVVYSFQGGFEIAHKPGIAADFGVKVNGNVFVVLDSGQQLLYKLTDFLALPGLPQFAGITSQLVGHLHQLYRKSLVCQGQGGHHACHATPHHQSGFVETEGYRLQRVEQQCPGHCHAHQVFGLFGSSFLVLLMHPGVLVTNVCHFKKIRIQSHFTDGLLEERFMGTRRASSHHHPVEVVLLYDLPHLLLGVL